MFFRLLWPLAVERASKFIEGRWRLCSLHSFASDDFKEKKNLQSLQNSSEKLGFATIDDALSKRRARSGRREG